MKTCRYKGAMYKDLGVPAGGSSLLRTARPVQVNMSVYVCVCVIGFGVWTVSVSVCLVCYGPARRRCRVWAS